MGNTDHIESNEYYNEFTKLENSSCIMPPFGVAFPTNIHHHSSDVLTGSVMIKFIQSIELSVISIIIINS